MHSVVTQLRYSWLADPAPDLEMDRSSEDKLKVPVPFPADVGEVWYSSFHLPMKVVFRRITHHFKPDSAVGPLPIAEVHEQMAEPVLMVQTLKSGRVVFSDRRVADELILGAHQCLFQRTDCLDQTTSVDTTEDIDAYLFIIGDSVLGELLGEEYGADLLRRLRVASVPAAKLHTLPRRITALLYDCRPHHLTGSIGKLYAQAKVLEFLSLLAEHLAVPPEGGRGHSPIDPKMARLHDELTRLQGKAPTLNELAKQYGMSARALNERFRDAYGQSIFACLSEARLAEAHEALLKTDTPIKAIAARLGYAHVSNFTSAFRSKYGYPPGSLRK